MNPLKNTETWICVIIVFAAIGRFIDYLLSTKIRKKEKAAVQDFFGRLFRLINKTDFSKIQLLMIEYVMRLKTKIFGEGILTYRGLLASLLISQYLTLCALHFAHLFDEVYFAKYDYTNLIPLLRFTGFSFLSRPDITVTGLLELLGIYWNNYFFDLLAVVSTFLLLKFVYTKKKYFAIVALFDVFLSYIFSYLCIIVYFATPPRGGFINLRFGTFISDCWHNTVPIYQSSMWLFYSLTTFVPILLYMSFLLFLSVLKLLQWLASTVASDFSEDSEKTPFFKIATALSITAFISSKILKLLWGLATT